MLWSKVLLPGSLTPFLFFDAFSLVLTPFASEKVSEVLDDVLDLCGSKHFRLNPTNEVPPILPTDPIPSSYLSLHPSPLSQVFDCGLLELREEVLQAMDEEMTRYLEENRALLEEICACLV